ncbi:hypothetical protein [Microbacterium amylolyticum]|uniref:Uncharacterized protein n=1 Tax=Microbacterium amylolyticum TaxID=936337 RepID=A0ABS4ZFJ5_9MICO|nr:hypothetical protein [Microbacterium amylolyticum]MBP2436061.1 hypothetical protein [Microbacterium amylolyticum]
MTSIDPAALEQVLTSIDVAIGTARRVRLQAAALLPLAPGTALLAYVADGVVHGVPTGPSGCVLDVDAESKTVAVRRAGDSALCAGDVFVTFGADTFVLPDRR